MLMLITGIEIYFIWTEFLTVFNGETGAAITTIDYEPARGTVSSWGDSMEIGLIDF